MDQKIRVLKIQPCSGVLMKRKLTASCKAWAVVCVPMTKGILSSMPVMKCIPWVSSFTAVSISCRKIIGEIVISWPPFRQGMFAEAFASLPGACSAVDVMAVEKSDILFIDLRHVLGGRTTLTESQKTLAANLLAVLAGKI